MAETDTTTDGTEGTETATVAQPQRRRITRRKAVEAHVRSYFDALANRDLDAMAAHWSDDAVDDLETTVSRVVAGETQAAVEWRMTGHFTGAPFQGIDPTDRRVDLRGLDLFEVEDGKITSNTAYYDGMSFARQVGLMPPENSSAENAMKSAFNAATKVRRAVADWRSGR